MFFIMVLHAISALLGSIGDAGSVEARRLHCALSSPPGLGNNRGSGNSQVIIAQVCFKFVRRIYRMATGSFGPLKPNSYA
jgi:hypothetical protein